MKTITDIEKLSKEDKDTKIHTQYYAFISDQEIENSTFTNKNQNNMIRKLKQKGIRTYYDLYREKKEKKTLNCGMR
jgi:hypothetical protein